VLPSLAVLLSFGELPVTSASRQYSAQGSKSATNRSTSQTEAHMELEESVRTTTYKSERWRLAVSKVLVLAVLLIITASSAFATSVFLRTRDIVNTKSKDGKTLVFMMRDGRTLVNHLQGICPDLKYNGFSWDIRGGIDEVCENEQSLRVLQSGEVCVLGKFDTPVAMIKAK
jgi:hypothetical protein